MPAPTGGKPDEEVELGAADLDTIFFDNGGIELGAALSDTLALALDPYPRSAGADAALKEAGVMSEEEASPFAVLELASLPVRSAPFHFDYVARRAAELASPT